MPTNDPKTLEAFSALARRHDPAAPLEEWQQRDATLLEAAAALNHGRDMLPWLSPSDPHSWRTFLDALRSLNHRWIAARAIVDLDFPAIKIALDEPKL